jgi:hypothetical protein
MAATSGNYDVKCMMCSEEVGQVLSGRFVHHQGCALPMQRRGGMLRCCHCGGSLYLDPIEAYPSPVDRAKVREMFANSAA